MDGFVICLISDADGSVGYWGGSAITQDLIQTTFFEDVGAARQAAGTLQNQYTDREIQVVPASKGITLKTSTANVATSNQSASPSI
ncbi:hypothetical protein [Gloeocapsopsis dulcis]|uniref:Uncharacterized protein n=1 Tax=Gloeocapsopsis dulcis AAB1 = 1H9 TaxID=1433147 RepID=A0A6N8G1Q5_9CHRO|nr:hypothetical protein [Gloeocapsopsis dulcis]MUL39348.1 hypothetical protein [Gloeocapsopsis dulcis AAB1 = 1H9]WNN89696.1 hypothetical protein P0S91_00945 [Gloeocapsopsis dulcis]